MKTSGYAFVRSSALVTALVASSSFAFGVVYASDQRLIKMLSTMTTKTDVDGTKTKFPSWQIELDREAVVQLSSEASVAECEALFAAGYRTCTIGFPPCLSASISPEIAVPFQLTVLPTLCGTDPAAMGAWYATGRQVPPKHVVVN